VLALNIHDYAGAPWRASLLTYDPDQALDAAWSFRPGVTPANPADFAQTGPGRTGELVSSGRSLRDGSQSPTEPDSAGFWRCRFSYDPALHGTGPFRLAMHALHKGQIWLNGRNVARYWQIGPQEHYKLPASWLQAENELLALDEGS
jgi:hypothetical protein